METNILKIQLKKVEKRQSNRYDTLIDNPFQFAGGIGSTKEFYDD